jgi:subtilisin family serine protease
MQQFVTRAAAHRGDPYRELQGALGAMGIEAAHRWSRGRGVRVALIDTGLGDGHPDLAGRVAGARDFVGAGRADARAESHALAVAGLIAASADNGEGIVGVAPESNIVAMRACWQPDPGRDAACSSFTLALALAAAIDLRTPIINLSLTGPRDPLLERLLNRAIDRGAVVVGAVPEDAAASVSFPTALTGVIAVQAAEAAGADGVAQVLAPGRELLTLAPGGRYDFESGSSLAAAQVSGVVALLLARSPRLSNVEVGTLLSRSAAANGDGRLPKVVNACLALADLLSAGSCTAAEGPRVVRGGQTE